MYEATDGFACVSQRRAADANRLLRGRARATAIRFRLLASRASIRRPVIDGGSSPNMNSGGWRGAGRLAVVVLLAAGACFAQDFTQRGFLESGSYFYPQEAAGDSGHAVSGLLLRYEAFYKASQHWRFSGGIDARTDTHHQVDREFGLSWWDRSIPQPAFTLRRLSAAYSAGKLNLEAGKQFIRWGKADILNPTDRFAPQDYLNVVQSDFLAVTAVRMIYGTQSNTIDLIWSPRLTPSRTPLFHQRWVALPENLTVHDLGSQFPGGPQYGARWNHIGRLAEYSLSFFDGYNHLPLIDASVQLLFPVEVNVRRIYPRIRMYGGDTAVPLRWLTLKTEAAYFTSSNPKADQYVLYVIQLERQAGEWFFVGGYAGEAVIEKRTLLDFAPDRGLSKAFLARAGYTIDANRSVALQTAVRQNAKGVWTRLEYSQTFGQHWRTTAGFTWIHGDDSDFLGQYHRNSHFSLVLRYSF